MVLQEQADTQPAPHRVVPRNPPWRQFIYFVWYIEETREELYENPSASI